MKETRTKKNKGIFRNLNKPLLILTIFLFIFGTLSVVSASANESISRYGYSIFYFFFRHVFMILVGSGIGFVILLIRTKWYRFISIFLWAFIFITLLFLFFYGTAKRGATNWITIPYFNIKVQPSEFAKPIIIVFLASMFEVCAIMFKKNELKESSFTALWIVFGCLIPGIVVFSGDIGTAAIILAISFGLYMIGPLENATKYKHIIILILCFSLFSFMIMIGRGYLFTDEQLERLTEFYNPCSKYEDSGYQICNCFIAINEGGLTGVGISKSKQKYSYIPEAYTDSIFAIIIEEDGIIWGFIILIIYFIMIANILKISKNAVTLRGKYISFGVAIYFFIHILFNLGGLLGILPLTGVPLPLISYGGSFTISFIAALALVQRVNIETKESIND